MEMEEVQFSFFKIH